MPRVWHPLLADHPDYDRAQALYPSGPCSAVVTLDLGCDEAGVFPFLSELRLVSSATTVGDVHTLCLYPAITSHRNLGPESRLRVGITEGTVRIATGIEDPKVIVDDLLSAIRRTRHGVPVQAPS